MSFIDKFALLEASKVSFTRIADGYVDFIRSMEIAPTLQNAGEWIHGSYYMTRKGTETEKLALVLLANHFINKEKDNGLENVG